MSNDYIAQDYDEGELSPQYADRSARKYYMLLTTVYVWYQTRHT